MYCTTDSRDRSTLTIDLLKRLGGALPLAALAALAGCAQPRPALPEVAAIPPGEGGLLDDLIAAAEARHPGHSAFRLVSEGHEAFVIRAQVARLATRSVDVQTYIWHADSTGLYLAQQVLEAADRGVSVRLLIDDMDARAKNAGFAALAAHPLVEVRLFNPFATRSGTLALLGEALTSFDRINHRMHNKSWIADNRVAVAGGRNIGDAYFGASDEVNFVDLDFAMFGPVVRDASASFDRYWNSQSAYPMETLDPDSVNDAALAKLRGNLAENAKVIAKSRYAEALRNDDAVKKLVAGEWPMQWTKQYAFVSDDPLKVSMTQKDTARTHVGATLLQVLRSVESSLYIISPYFVPGETTQLLVDTAQAGKKVEILTNSLVANDVAAVHGGYSRYREALLAGGVQLWELKPQGGSSAKSSLFGSSGSSLHTKALAANGRVLFVGSYNLDPRSTWLNCEQGVMVENTVLAMQLQEIFATQTSGARAWRVTLANGELHWTDGTKSYDSDPDATAGKRFQAWFARVLHLDAQL